MTLVVVSERRVLETQRLVVDAEPLCESSKALPKTAERQSLDAKLL
jgi:hypothetical protein